MLMTIGFSCVYGSLAFQPPRLANDAAKNVQNAFRLQRTAVFAADPLQYLAFARAVIDRQAARLLDPADFGSDPRPLVQQAQQLGVERVNRAAPFDQRFGVEFTMAFHVLSQKAKAATRESRLLRNLMCLLSIHSTHRSLRRYS